MPTKNPPKTAKKPRKASTDDPQPVEAIRTLEGVDVPAAELAHIAPFLRPFAVRVDSLTRDPRNARRHDDGDLPSTAESLRRFGQQHPVHFDPESRIIKIGNGRHEAAQKILKWKWVAAVPSNLSREELRAFALADNRTAEKSTWDLAALEDELAELDALGVGGMGDLGLSSHDLDEIDRLLAGADQPGPAAAPEPAELAPVGAEKQSRLDQRRAVECPNCQHRFVPGKKD